MTEIVRRLDETRSRVRAEGAQFLVRTREATALLGQDARDAGQVWWKSAHAASLDLRSGLQSEVTALARELSSEVAELGAKATELRPALAAQSHATEGLERTRQVQLELLVRLKQVLATLDGRVQARLEGLAPQTPLTQSSKARKAPFAGYDDCTAKEVVAALDGLSAKKRAALIAYERAHKSRRTVLRAAARHAA
jgi:hypothetical protein